MGSRSEEKSISSLPFHAARPGEKRYVHSAKPVLVGERKRVYEDIVRAPAPRPHRGPERRKEVGVGQRHPLGPTRSTRGVGEHRRIVATGAARFQGLALRDRLLYGRGILSLLFFERDNRP